jgi:hypothetical protein
MRTPLPAGRQMLVTEFADSPPEAIERFITLVAQPAPDAGAMGRRGDRRVRAAAVNRAILIDIRERGYAHVRDVDGGISEWARRGWPMVAPPR